MGLEEVKRYSLELGQWDDEKSMHEDSQGQYVGYEDFNRLSRRCRKLMAKLWWQKTGQESYVLYEDSKKWHRTRSKDGEFRSAPCSVTMYAIEAAEKDCNRVIAPSP